jgi:hypothetical protein
MSIEVRKKITSNLKSLRKLRSALNTSLATTEFFGSLPDSIKQLQIELEAEITHQALVRDELELADKKGSNLLKEDKEHQLKLIKGSGVTIKSETVLIEREIERLSSLVKFGVTGYPKQAESRIKVLKNELANRRSGIRKKPKIVQGGNTGLKK